MTGFFTVDYFRKGLNMVGIIYRLGNSGLVVGVHPIPSDKASPSLPFFCFEKSTEKLYLSIQKFRR